MTVPAPLLHEVRRGYYVKAKTNRNGGKGVPSKHSAIYGVYKRLKMLHKRRPTSDLKYQKEAVKLLARSRRVDILKKYASLERKYGEQRLGLDIEAAISELGVGAMRKLDFDGEQMPTNEPKTWNH